MKKSKLFTLCLTGILTSLVFLVTAYLHIPTNNGYTHVGDGVIFLAAAILPTPYALLVGALGASLADLLSGFAIWIPATIPIKALSAILFTARREKIICRRNIIALPIAAVISSGGYYLFECLLLGNFLAPIVSIPSYFIQALLSSALFIAVGAALDKLGIKKRYFGGLFR